MLLTGTWRRETLQDSYLQETIQDGNCEVQRLLQQLEPGVNLDQPVDEQSPHACCDLVTLHVVGSNGLLHLGTDSDETPHPQPQRRDTTRGQNYLQVVKIIVDVFDVLRAELRLVGVMLIHILHGEQRCRERLAQLLLLLLLLFHGHVSWLL